MIASRWFENIEDFINLELGCPKFRMNMEKFHYNPIPINRSTRHLFPNLETLYL